MRGAYWFNGEPRFVAQLRLPSGVRGSPSGRFLGAEDGHVRADDPPEDLQHVAVLCVAVGLIV